MSKTAESTDGRDGMRVAVVGSGVAGLTAAWLLQPKARVDLYDRNNYAGGHTCTIVIPDGPDAGCGVDMGFIVMNHKNYPLLTRLLSRLDVALGDSDMSFGYHCRTTGYVYSGSSLGGLFARGRNIVDPNHWGMLRDIFRFNRVATRELAEGTIADLTLGAYLEKGRYGRAFAWHYLLAMGSAIWSAPPTDVLEFPAEPFIQFFHNHGLLRLGDRPQWKFVKGGSQTYVRRMMKDFKGPVHLEAPVERLKREANGVVLTLKDGRQERYDRVVIAVHADEALKLLEDPSDEERNLLGQWKYQPNITTLHRDPAVMPVQKRAWASWNFARMDAGAGVKPVAVTYHMNRLQRLAASQPYFVTLNMEGVIDPKLCINTTVFTHPVYSFEAMATQPRLAALSGRSNTYYCGSYFGYGFHEDAVRSAVEVGRHFGVEL